jgi:hypothetical protein
LGSLEHKITCGPKAFQRLREILEQAKAENPEILDIVWDPTLDVQVLDCGPGGIDLIVGPDGLPEELRRKIQALIDEEMKTDGLQQAD